MSYRDGTRTVVLHNEQSMRSGGRTYELLAVGWQQGPQHVQYYQSLWRRTTGLWVTVMCMN